MAQHELRFTDHVFGEGDFDGNIRFSGTYSPGNGAGVVDFDDNASFDLTAVLEIQINGTPPGSGFDRLDVAGTANLGGTLQVIVGFPAKVGDQFRILNFAMRSGDFASYTGLDLGNGLKQAGSEVRC
jgi:hypothetical protein